MSTYAWIIDEDLLGEGEDDEAGWSFSFPREAHFPRKTPNDALAFINAGMGVKFRMYDDDDILHYTGRYMDNAIFDGDGLPETAFAPLDDWGMPNAGCTRIDYLIDGEWQQL